MVRKKSTQYKIWQFFLKTISSKWFFISITTFFFIEMAWIALSAIYPMLFDEEYHLGIIDIYARQISPFINKYY
jgi:nitrate/nitrite transporter NarK